MNTESEEFSRWSLSIGKQIGESVRRPLEAERLGALVLCHAERLSSCCSASAWHATGRGAARRVEENAGSMPALYDDGASRAGTPIALSCSGSSSIGAIDVERGQPEDLNGETHWWWAQSSANTSHLPNSLKEGNLQGRCRNRAGRVPCRRLPSRVRAVLWRFRQLKIP